MEQLENKISIQIILSKIENILKKSEDRYFFSLIENFTRNMHSFYRTSRLLLLIRFCARVLRTFSFNWKNNFQQLLIER
jgi:hypothetical protein